MAPYLGYVMEMALAAGCRHRYAVLARASARRDSPIAPRR